MPKQIIDYSNTIIYKIVCNNLNIIDVYIGHTTQFTKRKNNHKSSCNDSKKKSYHYNIYETIRHNGGWENWSMIEIEKFKCKDSNEAGARERYWYETLNSNLNTKCPNRKKEEYIKTNKEKIRQAEKISKLKYKEIIKVKQNKLCICEICKVSFTHSNKARHEKSLFHLSHI